MLTTNEWSKVAHLIESETHPYHQFAMFTDDRELVEVSVTPSSITIDFIDRQED